MAWLEAHQDLVALFGLCQSACLFAATHHILGQSLVVGRIDKVIYVSLGVGLRGIFWAESPLAVDDELVAVSAIGLLVLATL